jgi:nicotinamide riboside kinase
MKRIAIIGCGGSGKTHLARRLGAALAIPVTPPGRAALRLGLEPHSGDLVPRAPT